MRNAKQTEKLKKAELWARDFAKQGITPPNVIPTLEGQQEELYSWLNHQKMFWNADLKTWEYVTKKTLPYGGDDNPQYVAHVRLISHPKLQAELLQHLRSAFEAMGWDLSAESKPYPDREDTGERVYLEFRL